MTDRGCDKGCEKRLGEELGPSNSLIHPARFGGLGQKDIQTNDSRRVKRANCRLTNGRKGVALPLSNFGCSREGGWKAGGRQFVTPPAPSLTLSLRSPQSICNSSENIIERGVGLTESKCCRGRERVRGLNEWLARRPTEFSYLSREKSKLHLHGTSSHKKPTRQAGNQPASQEGRRRKN